MGPMTRLRRIGLRPLWLAAGGVVALALGVALGGGSSQAVLGKTRVVLDTPTSQLVEGAPYGADTLPWRARLLAHLLAGEDAKKRLAETVGISPDQLAVVDPDLSTPKVPTSLPAAAAGAAAVSTAPFVLKPYLRDQSLPIISIKVQAPDREGAAQLALAAADVLKDQTPPREALTDVTYAEAEFEAAEIVPTRLQGFIVDDVAPVRVKGVDEGPSALKSIAVATVVFALWWACLSLGPSIHRLVGHARPRSRLRAPGLPDAR